MRHKNGQFDGLAADSDELLPTAGIA